MIVNKSTNEWTQIKHKIQRQIEFATSSFFYIMVDVVVAIVGGGGDVFFYNNFNTKVDKYLQKQSSYRRYETYIVIINNAITTLKCFSFSS